MCIQVRNILQRVDISDWAHFMSAGNTHNRVYFSKFGTETLLNYKFDNPEVAFKNEVTLVFGSESKGLFDLVGKDAMDGPILSLPILVRKTE